MKEHLHLSMQEALSSAHKAEDSELLRHLREERIMAAKAMTSVLEMAERLFDKLLAAKAAESARRSEERRKAFQEWRESKPS